MSNTTKSITTGKDKKKTNAEFLQESELTAAIFMQEKKVPFTIPKVLIPKTGSEVFISVNGAYVVIPADGETYEIPETLAAHGQAYLSNLT